MDVRSAAHTEHARSIAILVGVGDADHTDNELRPVPATLNSLRALQKVLTDPEIGGWPAERLTLLRNPVNAGLTARRLRDLVRSARDTLLVYYAGEANVTPSGQLCLALHDTMPDAPERTGLSYTWLARALRDSPARRKVVVLDCCLPGRTGQFLDPVSDQIAELSDVEGVYTLTSTTRHHPAPVISALQQRPRPTVFTGQLVEMIESGLPGGPPDLTFEDLYPALRQRLVSMGLPPPNQRGTGAGRPLRLARNVAPRSAPASSIPPPPAVPMPLPRTLAEVGAGGSDAGTALAPEPDVEAAPALFTEPAGPTHNGTHHNGHGAEIDLTEPVGARPITGQTPVLGARLAGPEPPRPERPERPEKKVNGNSGHDDAQATADDPAGTDAGPRSDTPPGGWSRRRWLAVAALVLALLVPTFYFVRPAGREGTADGGPGGVLVDLRDAGNRTISLGNGTRLTSLLEDGDTLWIHSGARGTPAELLKVDLTSNEIVKRVPFPESDSVGTITAGAGSLWVTTASIEDMGGGVVRIDPDTGEPIATIDLPAWPGRAVFAAGSLWVATVQQPVAEELGATPNAMSSAANGLRRIDPETNELASSIQLEGTPLDVRATDDLVLVSTSSSDEAAVVAIDPASEEEVARIPIEEGAGAQVPVTAEPAADQPWMLFAADPYAVRVDVEAEGLAAVTGPRDGIDMVVPNGEQMWELRSDVLTILDGNGDELTTVTIDGTPLAAAAAGRGAAWIAYRPSSGDDVLVTRVSAAELIDLAAN